MHRFIGNVNYDYALTGVHFVTEVCVLSNIKNKQLENQKKKRVNTTPEKISS
jgi:hypothetical protein